LPKNAVITPNKGSGKWFWREVSGESEGGGGASKKMALKYGVTIVMKGEVSVVSDGKSTMMIEGGSEGLTKGGTGDVLAGLISGLLVNNEKVLAGAAGNFLVKKSQ